MRRLSLCGNCQRTYNVSDLLPDTKFLCACGQNVTVCKPMGHDSRVVRCGNCGGPRDEGGEVCGYCRAEFTLHDRDLNTVCPQCFARVSDHSKFCHSCSHTLTALTIELKDTQTTCPACFSNQLRLRTIGDGAVPIQECPKCAGFWLKWDAFQTLCQVAVRRNPNSFMKASKTATAVSRPESLAYRKCPDCQKVMNRFHYSKVSGVIVDVCLNDHHGVWFDLQELPAILAWLHTGGAPDPKITENLDFVSRETAAPREVLEPILTEDVHVIEEDIDLDAVLKTLFRS